MRFVPLYEMVSFSDVPYAEALERHRRQEAILERLLGNGGGGIDWRLAESLLDTYGLSGHIVSTTV
jgi:hypothetical protein